MTHKVILTDRSFRNYIMVCLLTVQYLKIALKKGKILVELSILLKKEPVDKHTYIFKDITVRMERTEQCVLGTGDCSAS